MSAVAVTAGPVGAPAVMLLHGLGGSYGVWDRVLRLIEPVARVSAVHLSSTSSIEDDADDAAAVIDGPTLLVGHSRGALVATAIAERHPGLASKLILLCPAWSIASRLRAKSWTERAIAVPGIGDLLWSAASEKRQRAALRTAFAPETIIPDQFVADLRSRGRRNLVRSNRAIDDYLKTRPLADRLADITTPVELVFGEHDARVAAPGDEFVDIRHVHLSVMPGVGHTPPWETPQLVARLITKPLRAV